MTNNLEEKKQAKKYAPDWTSPNSTFFLKRIPQQANRPYCHNLHVAPGAKNQTTGTKKIAASFSCFIFGYVTYLCPKCAVEWQRIWNSALNDTKNVNVP